MLYRGSIFAKVKDYLLDTQVSMNIWQYTIETTVSPSWEVLCNNYNKIMHKREEEHQEC